ncbi:hypothetical protein DPQ33_03800 [Oceanidesulfovibrio indonesiensis]|uniref:Sigma-54-dependent Fis family transcriptional regulator n=1 Tax=Oceanidesulfovibrio indonesiensis TaxID=54767 RepID=A0A7M3MJJ1_9BACT|nr:hypothetical protein DPQ33_03800 [Oceanidesulfovibrio indonesiensis]
MADSTLSATAMRALVIDDDPFVCDMLKGFLSSDDLSVASALSLKDGLRLAEKDPFDLIFLDVFLPDGDGLEKLDTFLSLPRSPAVIVITGAGDADSAERALYRGAWDYIPKPINARDVTQAAEQALRQREKQRSMVDEKPQAMSSIAGNSPKIKKCIATVLQAAATNANCLIAGETGTGKELFARAIHDSSNRAAWNFVVVDCTNIPENLAESVLSATTRARSRMRGKRAKVCSNRRIKALSSWTKSAIFPSIRKNHFSACCRRNVSGR